MPESAPAISVIVVTYNPRPELLAWALDSLVEQTLAPDEFEVIVVDNNSDPPLEGERVRGGRRLDLRLVREPRQGNTFARMTGIGAARGPLAVFVDDDNHLDPDYLEQARRLARGHPELGAFGGMARPVFETVLEEWKRPLLPYLGVRDYGPRPIAARDTRWGEWEPIGAGMVFRKEVGQEFVKWVESAAEARRLGRRGRALMSGEDCLIAQAAYRLGFQCSYQPELRMSHFMKRKRLRTAVLAGTLMGHGRSFIVIRRLLGEPVPRFGIAGALRHLRTCFSERVHKQGFSTGGLEWFWDLGYVYQARRRD